MKPRGYYHLVVAGGNSFPVELVALAFGFGGAGVGSGRALFLYGPRRRGVGGVFQQLATSIARSRID